MVARGRKGRQHGLTTSHTPSGNDGARHGRRSASSGAGGCWARPPRRLSRHRPPAWGPARPRPGPFRCRAARPRRRQMGRVVADLDPDPRQPAASAVICGRSSPLEPRRLNGPAPAAASLDTFAGRGVGSCPCSLITWRRMGPGGLRGLQTRCGSPRGGPGGFDSHTPPPIRFRIWDCGLRI